MRLFRNFSLITTSVLMTAMSLTSCSMMSEKDPDCVTEYKAKFVFKMHLHRGDEFSTQVDEVNLYVFDQAGELVWTGHEEGEALKQEGYMMDLPLPPGKYNFIAWCGQKHPDAAKFEFAYGDGVTAMDRFVKRLPRRYDGDVAYSQTDLEDLYHGMVESVELPADYGTHVVTIELTKDTNSIKIMLVHLNGETISSEDFDVKITDASGSPDFINASGLLGHDNAILSDEPIEYRSWVYHQGVADIVPPTTETDNQSRAVTAMPMHCFTAEMTTSRLQRCNNPMLIVTRKSDGEKIINNLPILDFFLMMRREHYSSMKDDEFLDRQDEYTMTFFLNEDQSWYKAVIDILSWRLVRQETAM